MGSCITCKRREVAEGVAHCKGCFCRIVEEQVRKGIRSSGALARGGQLESGNTAPAIVLARVLQIGGRDLRGKALVSARTIEDFNAGFFEEVLLGRNVSGKKGENIIYPLQDVSRRDCERYCTLKGLPFETRADTEMETFIAGFEARRPNIHRSIARSRTHIDETRPPAPRPRPGPADDGSNLRD